ncbi:MAG: DNA double-strand break repair nuclease NurA [Ignisphaera sp.]|uniref:DNA double-strand break repair nuclease NurA n=1 Tax=Ignisphaera aggregans TaxID=334771 RepID=A0A7C4D423_9CREN
MVKSLETIFPELEQGLPLLLKNIRDRFNKEKDSTEQVLKRYRWYVVEEETECSCAATDSSFLLIESRIGHIYVIQGVAAVYIIQDNTIKRLAYKIFSDVGLISAIPTKKSYVVRKSIFKKALTSYAYMLELENIVDITSTQAVDIVLIDGSFISFATTRISKEAKTTIESVKGVYSLESIENKKNVYLNELSKKKYSVFLAKSSNAGFYTQGLYSDMYILELTRLYKIYPYYRSGFLEPVKININALSKIIDVSNIGISDITVTYMRLRDNAPVYQISFPYEIHEEVIKYIASCLKRWSSSGYPAPLEYVHRISKIPRKSLINAMMLIGIPIISGREIIEIT